MPNIYSTIATGIFDYEFEANTGIATVSQISGWLSANIGGLNVLLHENFTGEDPSVNDAAANIFGKQYLLSYNQRAQRNVLRGVINSSSNGDNILSVSDGDNRISFVNKNELAKTYKGAANDLMAEIKDLSNKYSMYKAIPTQICGYEAGVSGSYPWNNDPARA